MTKVSRLAFGVPVLLLLAGGFPLASAGEIRLSADGGTSPLMAAQSGTTGDVQDSPNRQVPAGDNAANQALWDKAQRMYAKNDFAQASAAAARITSPSLKKGAEGMMGQIKAYATALQDGAAAEGRHDPDAALKAYGIAAGIKSDGPGDPAGRVTRVQRQTASDALIQAQQAKTQQFQRAAQQRAKSAQLFKKGLAEEAAGDPRGSLASLQAAQAADPTNAGASQAVSRLKTQLLSGPATEPSPGPAIRALYTGQYREAEQELQTVVASPRAQSLGAAFFYLAAAHFYRSVLEAGQSPAQAAGQPEVQSAFKRARSLGYIPLPQFVSPDLLRVWQSSQ